MADKTSSQSSQLTRPTYRLVHNVVVPLERRKFAEAGTFADTLPIYALRRMDAKKKEDYMNSAVPYLELPKTAGQDPAKGR